MSLDKAIQHGKEHRKAYRGAKAVDRTCRNHGSDEWERSNRMISTIREKEKLKYKDNDFGKEVK